MDSPSPTEHMFLSPVPGRDRDNEMLPMGPEETEDETLRYLRDQYNLAKQKAKELNTKNDTSVMKPRTRKAASKLYSAVATVIYTTISNAKTSDVEKFINKRSTQLPAEYFDAPYWQEVLNTAAEVRGVQMRQRSQSPLRNRAKYSTGDVISKDVVQAYLQEVQRRAREVNNHYEKHKAAVSHELAKMEGDMLQTKAEATERINKLQRTITELKRANEELEEIVFSNSKDGDGDMPKRMYSAEELEQARRKSVMRVKEEHDKKRESQLNEFLASQRENEEARKRADLAIMEKHRQEFGAMVFEYKEKMKEMQSKHDQHIKNMTHSHNLAIEQLMDKITVLDQVPPVKDIGSICRDCLKHQGRIVELEANLDGQQRKVADLTSKLAVSKNDSVKEVMRTSSNISEAALYTSFSNVEDVIERTKLQKEIDLLKEVLVKQQQCVQPPPPGADDKTKDMLQTQLKINKDLMNQVEDLKFKLQMVDRSHSSKFSEAERLDIIRKNSSLITMNYISGTVGKSVSAKVAARIGELQADNDRMKVELEHERRLYDAIAGQNTSLQLQELRNQVALGEKQHKILQDQLTSLQADAEKSAVGGDVTGLALEQCRQQLNAEIQLNEELKEVNSSMQEQLVTTTSDYTKLQFQYSLTSEKIMTLRQKISDLEARISADDKRLRDAAIVGTTASLRRQQSSHLASNVVSNAIATSVQKSASLKSQSFKHSLEADEITQLKKTITQLQKQLTDQDMLHAERVATVQMALENAIKRSEAENNAKAMNDQKESGQRETLYRQVSAAALKTVNETVIASVLNSIDILARAKSIEGYNTDTGGVEEFGSHFSAELANKGILVAAPDTIQGNTGWYILDEQYMYFCNINDEFVLVCGPLSEREYVAAISPDKLSFYENSTVEMNQQFGSVDKSTDVKMAVDPSERVLVEICAIRGAAIQRDRLLRGASEEPIDLVIPDSDKPKEEFVSLEITRGEDETFTMASVSVDDLVEEKKSEPDMFSESDEKKNTAQQSTMAEGKDEADSQNSIAEAKKDIKESLSRINTSMRNLRDDASLDSSMISISDRYSVPEVEKDVKGKASTTHGSSSIKESLTRINSSMRCLKSDVSLASSMISFSDDEANSEVLSVTDDEESKGGQEEPNENQSGMPNIVTTVIIKMLRKEIKHLKEMHLADTQQISALKGRLFDDESTMASDTDYIRSMNRKLLSESNLAALYMDDSPCGPEMSRGISAVSLMSMSPRGDEPAPAAVVGSSRRPSRAPDLEVVKEERGVNSAQSSRHPSTKVPPGGYDSNELLEVTESDLRLIIKNLRQEVHACRGMLQDDSVIISALKEKLGLEDTDEIEIPGYIGVHSVRTSNEARLNTFTDADGDVGSEEGKENPLDIDPVENDEEDVNAELKHKVHILRNLMIQQGTQVRELMKALEEVDRGTGVARSARIQFSIPHQPDIDFEQELAKITNLEEAKDELLKLHYANQDQLSVIKGYEIQVSSLQTEVGEVMLERDREKEKGANALKDCRDELSAARASLLQVNNHLDELKYRHDVQDNSAKSQLPFSNEADDWKYKMARKVQNRMRIYLARSRIRTVKQMLAAREAKVLFALKHTTQGETGWYAAPDGSLFYFVLDGDSWILACGPVQAEEFEAMVAKASMALKGTHKAMVGSNVLVKCNFELSNIGDNQDSKGDVYMSAKTHKLYLSFTVETVVISDGSRIMSDGGGSRLGGSTSLVEDSNSLIQMGDGGVATQGSTTLPSEPTAEGN